MAQQPGGLLELDRPAAKAWDEVLVATLAKIAVPDQVLPAADQRTPEVTGPDWPAYPARIESCLSRRQAHQLFDWRTADGDEGRLRHQEEYLEWRVIRDAEGLPQRIEMTTEFSAYWRVLAAHQPKDTVELVGRFAGEAASTTDVYGDLDPFAVSVKPAAREAAFAATMLPRGDPAELGGVSPYNSGQKAICCMIEPSNTLGALINLVAAAAEPHLVTDSVSGEARFMSGSEAIQVIRPGAAQDCRNSDPVVVERVIRLASEGRLIAFDDPIGVYIQGVLNRQLVQPDGSDVPLGWFDFGRGLAPEQAPDRRARHQRLALQVPADKPFGLGDLRQRTTDEPIRHGAQIAELVTLGVYIRTSPQGVVDVEMKPEPLPEVTPCSSQADCGAVAESWGEFQASNGGVELNGE